MAFTDKLGYKQIANTTGVIKATPAGLFSITCVVGGAVVVYDNASAGSGVVLYTKTLVAGDVVNWGSHGIAANNGLTAVVTTGTMNIAYT
jgi:hypothetical protein